jgi:hypothetical protein
VVTTDDGGCWFVDGTSIFKITSDAFLEETIDLSDYIAGITYMEMPRSKDYFWIIYGEYIYKFTLDGRLLFSVYSTYSPIKLFPVSTGCWYKGDLDTSFRFIDDNLQAEIESYSFTEDNSYREYAFRDLEYDAETVEGSFPVATDTHWNSLNWKSVVHGTYNFPINKYNQIRLTLHRDQSGVSPEVEKFIVQNSVELQRIPPGSSENIYLKTEIPDANDSSYTGSYNAYIRARWGIPI